MDEKKTLIIINKIQHYLSGAMEALIPLTPEISRTTFPRSKKWLVIENTTIES